MKTKTDILAGYNKSIALYAEQTKEIYYRQASSFLDWLEGREIGLFSFTERDILEYLKQYKGCANTYNVFLYSVKSLYRFLFTEGYLKLVSTDELRFQKQEKLAPRHVSDKDIQKLMNYLQERVVISDSKRKPEKPTPSAFKARRNLLICSLALYAGLRSCEIRGLKMDHVTPVPRGFLLEVIDSKGGRNRKVPVCRHLKDTLDEYLNYMRTFEYWTHKGDIYLVSRDMYPWPTTSSEVFSFMLSRKAGVEFSLHRLRHNFARSLFKKGVGLTVIMELLGHATITTTAIYLKPSMEDLVEAVDL